MKRTAARIASALLAFILGTIASSLWHYHSLPQRSPAHVQPAPVFINEPITPPIIPTPDRNLVFGGRLKLVSNEVQLKNEVLRYEVNLTYPQIEGTNALPIRNLNKSIERLALKQDDWLLNPSREDLHYYKTGPHPEVFNSVALDFEVVLATDSFLSIYFEGYSYGIGAAHSVQYSFVVNYDLKSNRQIKLSDIFKPGSKYLEFISEFCKQQLSERPYGEGLWRDELAPAARNFESWNMTHDGIRFNFDACKVFGCAGGKQSVLVPFSALRPMMSIR
jgi:hypothetical protein